MQQLAQYIDHTILKAESSEADVRRVCREAIEHKFYSVCVNSAMLPLVKKELSASSVKLCSVIGFPLGANLTSVKVFETQEAIRAGAQEIDMVINIGLVKSKKFVEVGLDIQAVKEACGRVPLKVILETSLLNKEEKVWLCEIAKDLGVAFVKTSTGFNGGGASKEDVELMAASAGPAVAVKASGGVRSYQDAKTMIAAGASRLGTSSGVAIIKGQEAKEAY